jgi:hypothetical protein
MILLSNIVQVQCSRPRLLAMASVVSFVFVAFTFPTAPCSVVNAEVEPPIPLNFTNFFTEYTKQPFVVHDLISIDQPS